MRKPRVELVVEENNKEVGELVCRVSRRSSWWNII